MSGADVVFDGGEEDGKSLRLIPAFERYSSQVLINIVHVFTQEDAD